MSTTSDRLDLAHHARCKEAMPPGFRLYGSTLGAGFSALDERGSRVDFPQAALVEFERLRADFAQERARAEKLRGLLKDLHAQVWGECPGLLNEDSGGDGALDAEIEEALEER